MDELPPASKERVKLQKITIPSRYSSGTKSHRIYLPFTVLILIIYFYYVIIIFSSSNELIPIIPGTAIMDALFLLVILPLISYFLIVLAPIGAMIYYKLYQRIFKKSKIYFLDMRVQLGNWTPKDIAKRALTPGLILCAFAQGIVNAIGISSWVPEQFENDLILALYNTAFVALPIVILLLAPLWLLYDAGVMSKTTTLKTLQKRTPETIETIDHFFINKFKGFGGIAFLSNFFIMIIQIILNTISPLIMIFVLILPFLGVALVIPGLALYEKVLPFLTKTLHKSTKLHMSKITLVKVDQCPACNKSSFQGD